MGELADRRANTENRLAALSEHRFTKITKATSFQRFS
jgi:hypothetical protein